MIAVFIIAHGQLAPALKDIGEHVVGEQELLFAYAIEPNDPAEAKRQEILAKVEQLEEDEAYAGTIVLTDMFGGTPSNIAFTLMHKDKLDVIAGMNLPMLVKLLSVRSKLPLEEAVEAAREAGTKYIRVGSQALG